MFFFGYPIYDMRRRLGTRVVSLHVARETTPYYYERLASMSGTNLPDLTEIGYLSDEERLVCANRGGGIAASRVEQFGRDFIEQVTKREF